MRRPKVDEIWTRKRDAVAWPRVRVLDVLGGFISYAESYPGGAESLNPAAGFVDDFVKRYSPPPLELPDAQAILPLTATGFVRAATFNHGLIDPSEMAVVAFVKVTVVDNIVSVEVEEPE